MEIPKKFTDLIGKEMKYQYGENEVTGIVQECKFCKSQYMDMKTYERWHGIKLKIKPDNGFNLNRAIWTKAFNSGIAIDEF